jgi:DNA-binding response OmpR family regulator
MSMKVMISDPDWRFVQQVSTHLESRAHHVVNESTPLSALERARSLQPELVILAAEFASEEVLNQLYAMNPRPAVLLTGWMDDYARAWRAWQRGGDELLVKPVFRTSELHQAVVSALENCAIGARRPAAASA